MRRILIADDHSAIRAGVKFMLKGEFPDAEFGEASNAEEALEKLREQPWHLMILDMDMPGRSGMELLEQLKEEGPEVRVLMFSMLPENQLALRALRSGAYGYLSKNTLDSELLIAVRQVLEGRRYILPSVAEELALCGDGPALKPLHESLSAREYATLLLMAGGKSISEIAEALNVGRSSVSTFRARILEKMNLKTNAGIVKYVVEYKLLDAASRD